MSAPNPAALREDVVALARRAGAAIMDVYAGAFEVQQKADRSPLTEADMAAHRVIVAGLGALTPALPVLSEESAAVAYAERSKWSRYWLVDPLDGTREFVKRNGEFTVNIALIDHGRPVLGVVYAPVLDLMASAAAGRGTLIERKGEAPRVGRVAPRKHGPLRIAGSRSHYAPRTNEFLERIGEHELISLGSSLKFCVLAEGGADLYIRYGPTSEWDTAAGQCVLEEAGGVVTDFAGRPLTYNRGESLINPDFIASADPSRDWRPLL